MRALSINTFPRVEPSGLWRTRPSAWPLVQVPMKYSPVVMLNEGPVVSRVQRAQSEQ